MGAECGGSPRQGRHGGRGPRWALLAAVAGVATVVAVVAAPAGCAGGSGGSGTGTGVHGPTSVVLSTSSPDSTATAPPLTASAAPATPPAPSPQEPVTAEMSIPSIGIENLHVTPYEGTTDDREGTRIQDRGVAASPYGERGGVGPGEIGNYLVTAHRLSAGGPLRDLPSVEVGDLVHITAEGTVYTYEIVETRTTSFRSARSLAEQRAAVPGEPDGKPTRAMLTLSTCATPEDDAAGNFWRDAQNNPEHRIDKIGMLVSTRTA
ncbi:class E sortase [Streptomyces sp. NPDC056169]|uniref:class E sortase n=1 Tax=Streptomyces sp. NPDC056169 TaxID=3345734 RepID=UPI0035E28CAC